jgi:hypothetical protein
MWCLTVLLGLALAPSEARADELETLVEQLLRAPDFRVRTQAALALGATKDARALDPLCRGLDDEATTVRAASAAALGKLRKGGGSCLRKRRAVEQKEAVKSVITRALERLGADEPEPVFTDATKYLLVVEVEDATGRSASEVPRLVRRSARDAAANFAEMAFAAGGTTPEDARQLLAGKDGLKAFSLSVKVKPPEYAGSKLVIKLEVAIFTFLDSNLKGTFSRTLSIDGLSAPDKSAENELIQTGAARIVEMFAKTAGKID